jgi:endonuclease YncB( thermonuclease family)
MLQGDNIAEEILKLGFATVDSMDFSLENDKLYSKYYKKLLKLEDKAEKQRVGIWSSGAAKHSFGKTKEKIINISRSFLYKVKNFKKCGMYFS